MSEAYAGGLCVFFHRRLLLKLFAALYGWKGARRGFFWLLIKRLLDLLRDALWGESITGLPASMVRGLPSTL